MTRITVTEDAPEDPLPVGLDHGSVTLAVTEEAAMIATATVTAFPGSPAAPAQPEELSAKVEDCLALYNQTAVRPVTPVGFQSVLQTLTSRRPAPALASLS
jgi:hypothetical protein